MKKKIIIFFMLLLGIFSCSDVKYITRDKIVLENVVKNEKESVILYVSSWCPHCQELLDILDKEKENIKKEVILVFIPYIPNNGKLENYYNETLTHIKSLKLPFKIFVDDEMKIKEKYEITSLPTVFLAKNSKIEKLLDIDNEVLIEILKGD